MSPALAESTVRRCVLTGVSSGIGLALARRLLDAGWQVLGLDRQPPPPLPAGLRFHRCDLSDWQAADDAAFESLLAEGGGVHAGVHAFVHCAGIVRSGGAFDTDVDDAALLYRLHVEAAIRLMGGLKQHLADEGRVVLVASRGVLGRANRVPYAASKAAQLGLARSWAAELVRRRITVNVVAPGATDTPQLVDPARGAPPQVDLPIGRLINADEVAGTIAFLLGPDAGAITGQTLFVCGGASLGIAHV